MILIRMNIASLPLEGSRLAYQSSTYLANSGMQMGVLSHESIIGHGNFSTSFKHTAAAIHPKLKSLPALLLTLVLVMAT